MLSIPVFNMKGERTGQVEIDPALLGGEPRVNLLKQAVVAFRDHQRQRSARTKGKSDTEGSTRKMYRQKGTGNARMGQIRVPHHKGGGRAFAKRIPTRTVDFPKKMRRLARASAILAKIQSNDALILSDLACPKPRTKTLVGVLNAVGAEKGCVLALHAPDQNVYLSGRNMPKTDVRVIGELNAYEILRRRKLVMTRGAFDILVNDPMTLHGASELTE